MAMASAMSRQEDCVTDLNKYMCAICMELFCRPVRISCGNDHTYCQDCLKSLQSHQCPQCRKPFHPNQTVPANEIEIIMRSSFAKCSVCGSQMPMSSLRKHMETCGQTLATPKFRPIKETSQPVPLDVPNRSTFKCPYCEQANLDCKDLVKHCNNVHRHERIHVVCPICASMPWGNPSQFSSNFIQHLNARHTFEYDTYVDYGQDDDEMLMAAIQASLQER
ncbi:RING finger protein 166-like [Pomacea canaliculata]|uniref:RING finger protein 166-like n=1 Tax=Pomacea canaliculata TaxID=400727 RepID=UPI000D73E551|nr:RING finger protein 166-like [Pomacea canaliculata]